MIPWVAATCGCVGLARMASPTFYQTPADEIGRARTRLDGLEVEIHRAYARWAELESLAGAESASADD